MTLLELMIAMSIMVMVVGALGFLAKGVEQGFQYTEGHGTATQHARIALQRIETTVREATANEQFPGILVVSKEFATWEFPDTLVVWKPKRTEDNPNGDPADPDGLPLFKELVIFCPDAAEPNKLVEITVRKDERRLSIKQASWRLDIEAIKTSPDRESVLLTGLMRTCSVEGVGSPMQRGAIRFVSRLRPSQDEWADYVGEGRNWDDWKQLSWVQGISGSQTGLRQAWVAIELQMMPGKEALLTDPSGQRAIPFPGSAALYYEMPRMPR